jgi:hypothetical protein
VPDKDNHKVELRFHAHPSEDDWEEYAFGRLGEPQAATLEEHLLVCTVCQSTLERVDSFLETIRSADPPDLGRGSRIRIPVLPRISAAGIAAVTLVCIGLPVTWHQRPEPAPVVISLASFRGDTNSTVPAEQPIELSIPQTDLPSGGGFHLEVVTSTGSTAWKGMPSKLQGNLDARIGRGLNAGDYWVRLFDGNSGLLREYGLSVR